MPIMKETGEYKRGVSSRWPTPCAACKLLKRRCSDSCILAPYFPPNDAQRFITVHKIFPRTNMIRMLEGVPENKRALVVDSLVYEANARVKDPVYGCTGIICILHQQILRMEAELAHIRELLINCRQLQLNERAFPPASHLPENTGELWEDMSELFSTQMSLDHLLDGDNDP